jgi:hypothetical protein
MSETEHVLPETTHPDPAAANVETVDAETVDRETSHQAGRSGDAQANTTDPAEQDDDFDDLDDMEFMLDEIENRIAPLA